MKKALGVVAFSFLAPFVQRVPQSITEADGNQARQAVFFDSTLNQSNVNASTFGRIGTLMLDGQQVISQPLFVQGVTIGTGTHDLIIVDTMNNSVFVYDANTLAQIWSQNFGAVYATYPGAGVPSEDSLYDQGPGCPSTPAVDRANGWVFAVCAGSSGAWTLRKLNLTTGAVISSVAVAGSVTGTGDPQGGDMVSGGILSFYPQFELQRSDLAIVNGTVYFGFSSFGDVHPWHGWLFGYSESTLSQTALFCGSPNGYGAGIWMGGGAPAVDSAGNIYIVTGNGDWDGSLNWGESIIKFNQALQIQDWFTPTNWATLNSQDLDLSSSRAILTGDGWLFAGAKDYREFGINTACMGHLQSSGTCSQTIWTVSGSGHFGIFGGVFFNRQSFVPVNSGPVSQFPYSGGGTWITSSPITTSASFGHPGAAMSVSWNGSASTGVIWAITCVSPANATPQPGILRAFNPATLAELYNSTTNPGDSLGTMAKLTAPLVVNGRVFVSTGVGSIAVYGLK